MTFNFQEWLLGHTWWEDPDTDLYFNTTENGGVSITDSTGDIWGEGDTLEEACQNFDQLGRERFPKWDEWVSDRLSRLK